MAEAHTVAVLLKLRDEATQGLKRAEGAFGRFASGVQRHQAGFRRTGLALTAVGGAITGLATLAVKSSQEQEIGINRLNQSLKNVGTSYAAQKDQIEAVIEAQQRKTNFGDEAQRDALQKLVTIGGKWEGSLKALKVTTDVAAGANIDLNAAALLVGKAIAGETSSLSRYGILLEKGATQTEIMAALTKQFGGAAEAAADPFTQLKNRLGDMMQVLGDALLPMIAEGAKLFERVTRQVIDWAAAHPTLTKVLTIAVAALGALMLAVGPVLIALPMLAAGIALVTGAAAPWLLILGAVVLAVAAVGVGIILLRKNWDTVWGAILRATELSVNFIIDLFNKMTRVHREALAGMIQAAQKLVDLIPGMGDFADKMQGAVDKIRAGIPAIDMTTEQMDQLRDSFGETGKAVQEGSTTAADSVTANMGKIGEVLDDTVVKTRNFAEKSADAFDELVDSYAGVGDAAEELSFAQRRNLDFAAQATAAAMAKMEANTRNFAEKSADAFDELVDSYAGAGDAARELSFAQRRNLDFAAAEAAKFAEAQADAMAEADLANKQYEEGLQRLADNAKAASNRINEAFSRQTDDMVFRFSEQGRAWQELGGTTTSVLDNMATVLGKDAEQMVQFLSQLRVEGDTWKDSLLRLDEQGVINLNNLAEAFKNLGEAADDAGEKIEEVPVPKLPSLGDQTSAQATANVQAIARQMARNVAAGLPAGFELAGQQAVTAQVIANTPVAHQGGVIGGPPGSNQLIMAQAGERILPRGGGGGSGRVLNLVMNFNAPAFETKRVIGQAVREIHDDGGFDFLDHG